MVKIIHFQETFLFTYDVLELLDVSNDFSDPRYNIDNFIARMIVVVKFQILLLNFKDSKKIDVVKAYSFRLLRVYLVDDPIHSTISTLNKHQQGEDK